MEQHTHECTDCGRSSTEHKSLLRHLRTPAHAKKAGETAFWYYCEEVDCGERFARKDGLTRHSKEVHQGLKRNPTLQTSSISDDNARSMVEAATQSGTSCRHQKNEVYQCVRAMRHIAHTYETISYHWGTDHGGMEDVIGPLERRGALDSIRHFAHFHNLGEHFRSLLRHSSCVFVGGATGQNYALMCQSDLVHITVRLFAITAALFQHNLLAGSHGMVVVSLMRWINIAIKDTALPNEIIDVLNTRHSPQQQLQVVDPVVQLSCVDIRVWQSGFSLLATISPTLDQSRARALLRFCLNLKKNDDVDWDMAVVTGDSAMSLQRFVHDEDCRDYIKYATKRFRGMQLEC